MELKEFITTTLVDIIEGVYEARMKVQAGEAAKLGGEVTPFMYGSGAAIRQEGQDSGVAHNVEFDVAVSAEETDKGQAGAGIKAGIKVFSMSAGVGGETGWKDSRVSRVKFAVPIALPRGRNTERRERQTHAQRDDGF